ncbi:hypothetical protein ACFQ22_10410 [Lentilactobacillus raoultii]|uniref:Uncharacterized protein n=1 Tax=Lentilactobacillus raoultii TaxID=1987503 RepID=A0ABW3PQH8_9LACO|nr:hypothetical protein [Lentilactobacillus raoultii]
MEVFTEKALLLEVLNTICDKLEIKSSALVFLNRSYSDSDIQNLFSFLAKIEIKKSPVTSNQLASEIQKIKPDTSLQTAQRTVDELITAFQSENRFPWILSQLGH